MKNLMKAVDEPTQNKIKGWLTRDLIAKATSKEGHLIGKNLEASMFSRGGLGKESIGQPLIHLKELSSFKSVANAITLGQAKQGDGAGRMWIQLTQGSALVGLYCYRQFHYLQFRLY